MTRQRLAGALVLVLVAALLVFGDAGRPGAVAVGRDLATARPVADPAGVLTSTWFCAAGVALPGGPANLTVAVANTTGSAREGRVIWMPVGAAPVVAPFVVPARDSVSLRATDDVKGSIVSAVVETTGGGTVVEHVLTGTRGSAVTPCASRAAPTWYFANGITERDAGQVLALFNPFPNDSVVDLELDTDLGREAPGRLQGLPVPARSTVFVDVGQYVRRRAVTATTVRARAGRIVVDRIQAFDGSRGRTGLSVTLGATRTAEEWFFPDGLWSDAVAERWHVYNPGRAEAVVSLQVVPDTGDAPEPVDLTLPPGGQITAEARLVGGVASGVAHSSSVVSQNGVGVVVEREIDARAPAARRGWTSDFGATGPRRTWAFTVGETSGATDEWIVVNNPGTRLRRFSIAALAGGELLPIEGLQDLAVPAAGRVAARLGDHIERGPLPIVVTADGPVVAERDLYGVGRVLVSSTIGVPLRSAAGRK